MPSFRNHDWGQFPAEMIIRFPNTCGKYGRGGEIQDQYHERIWISCKCWCQGEVAFWARQSFDA